MIVHCPHCRRAVEKKPKTCPHCGEAMSLRREREVQPGQTISDLNKFIVVAIVFFLLLIPLGMCIAPG